MGNHDEIRAIAREILAARAATEVDAGCVDDDDDYDLTALAQAGAWIRTRTDAFGRVRLTGDEAARLVATQEGRRVAAALAEDLDLGALALGEG